LRGVTSTGWVPATLTGSLTDGPDTCAPLANVNEVAAPVTG
jgi:hypothetical protein